MKRSIFIVMALCALSNLTAYQSTEAGDWAEHKELMKLFEPETDSADTFDRCLRYIRKHLEEKCIDKSATETASYISAALMGCTLRYPYGAREFFQSYE